MRTIDQLTVETESEEQSFEVRMQNGCVLVLEAVDAISGIGIPKVSFWEEFDDEVRKGRRGVQSSKVMVDNPTTHLEHQEAIDRYLNQCSCLSAEAK